MLEPVKVKKAQIAPILAASFPEYRGRSFKVYFTEKVTLGDLNWDGGTKCTYRAVRMSDGKCAPFPHFSPWNNPLEGKTIPLPESGDIIVVVHSYFCGQDMGITFYAHPSAQQKMLPGT